MPRKILLDTNILLDAAMLERPERTAALLLLEEVAYNQAQGFLCPLSLKDVYYILSKYSNEAEARGFIKNALVLFDTVTVDQELCIQAANSDEPDFEDGIVRACAETAGVDFIISRDAAAFRKSPIKRLSAEEYLRLFCDIEDIEL